MYSRCVLIKANTITASLSIHIMPSDVLFAFLITCCTFCDSCVWTSTSQRYQCLSVCQFLKAILIFILQTKLDNFTVPNSIYHLLPSYSLLNWSIAVFLCILLTSCFRPYCITSTVRCTKFAFLINNFEKG